MELSKIAWNVFTSSGDIEFYMLYHEMESQDKDAEQPSQNASTQNEY